MLPTFHMPMNQNIINNNTRLPINQLPHILKSSRPVVHFPSIAVSIDSKLENRLNFRTREYTFRTRARIRCHKSEKRSQVRQPVGDSESADHPLKS
uniref:Uncharacterized protein n=1 Tax=Rhizophora mucronata TaxID=61149 RepID=A0A2P2Q4H3_RHIMU